MSRILIEVPKDQRSPVIAQGIMVAELMHAPVTLVQVVRKAAAQAQAETNLRELASGLAYAPVEVRVLVGEPADVLHTECQQGGYSMFVSGRKLANGLTSRWQRREVLRICGGASCGVLLVRGTPRPVRRILLCEGGDPERPLLNRLLSQLPQLIQPDQQLAVLHVMSQISVTPSSADWQLQADADALIRQQTREGELLLRDIQTLSHGKTTLRPIIRHGFVVDEILAESRSGDYDLVIIGAHRSQGWALKLMSDIAADLVKQCDRSLLIIQ